MADYRDVMHARHEADSLRTDLDQLAGSLEDGRNMPTELAQLLAVNAVCLELRALGTTIEYCFDNHGRQAGGY